MRPDLPDVKILLTQHFHKVFENIQINVLQLSPSTFTYEKCVLNKKIHFFTSNWLGIFSTFTGQK